MKVRVISGYGKESVSAEEQEKFLRDFKNVLEDRGLPIDSMVSERATGGPVILDVPDYVEHGEITKAFVSFATDLARQEKRTQVSFDLILPGCSEPITVLGTGY